MSINPIPTQSDKRIETMICDGCGCSFDADEAIQGEDFCYYYCSETCRKLVEGEDL